MINQKVTKVTMYNYIRRIYFKLFYSGRLLELLPLPITEGYIFPHGRTHKSTENQQAIINQLIKRYSYTTTRYDKHKVLL